MTVSTSVSHMEENAYERTRSVSGFTFKVLKKNVQKNKKIIESRLNEDSYCGQLYVGNKVRI